MLELILGKVRNSCGKGIEARCRVDTTVYPIGTYLSVQPVSVLYFFYFVLQPIQREIELEWKLQPDIN